MRLGLRVSEIITAVTVSPLTAIGAIGTARYVGVSLKKVIKACGGLVGAGKHLELYGAETYFKKDNTMVRYETPRSFGDTGTNNLPELCRKRAMVEGKGQRGDASMGDERRATA